MAFQVFLTGIQRASDSQTEPELP